MKLSLPWLARLFGCRCETSTAPNTITEETISIPVERYEQVRDSILADQALHYSFIRKVIVKIFLLLSLAIVLTPFLIFCIWVAGVLFYSTAWIPPIAEWNVDSVKSVLFMGFEISAYIAIGTSVCGALFTSPLPSVYKNLLKYRLLADEPGVQTPAHYVCGRLKKHQLNIG